MRIGFWGKRFGPWLLLAMIIGLAAAIIKEGKIVDIESIADIKKKRLYTIEVFFKGKVPKAELAKAGVEITKEFSDGLVLSVKRDVAT